MWRRFGRLLLGQDFCQSFQSFQSLSLVSAAPRQVLRIEFPTWRRLVQSLNRFSLMPWRFGFLDQSSRVMAIEGSRLVPVEKEQVSWGLCVLLSQPRWAQGCLDTICSIKPGARDPRAKTSATSAGLCCKARLVKFVSTSPALGVNSAAAFPIALPQSLQALLGAFGLPSTKITGLAAKLLAICRRIIAVAATMSCATETKA